MMDKNIQAFKKVLGERNTAQQLYFGVCKELDQQLDEIMEAKKETNKIRAERNSYKKELKKLKEEVSFYEGVEDANADAWAELLLAAESQSLIKEMEEDYEKRKRKVKDIEDVTHEDCGPDNK